MAEDEEATNASLISLLTVELHLGEAEAIALALEMQPARVLIDERDGRLGARQLGLRMKDSMSDPLATLFDQFLKDGSTSRL